jgi:uroporphyrinogen-III synthase
MALAGLRVGTIAGRRGGQLADAMRRRGATVLWGPTLRADVAERVDVLLSATDLILAAAPRFVAVSTAVGIRRWIAVADEFGRGPALHALFTAAHLAARGPKAVSGLLAVGHRPAFVSPARIDADVARWAGRPCHRSRRGRGAAAWQRHSGHVRARGARRRPAPSDRALPV